ncbi:MAG: response regulator transcription factor [Phycisphaerae bacterium]|jgi:two-component system alkaline phosphatase synthesis response regulator PhoP|nr:response regulator transcription factor [Phycisphaerae bacterium]
MSKATILVVDDEEDILELVKYNLAREGYQVHLAATGEEGISSVRSQLPDLVILDLMLPGIDGLEVCRQLRNDSRTSHLPIIMLTAKGDEADMVTGLELGADDYIAKPFSPRVLVARVKTVLRRKGGAKSGAEEQQVITIQGLVINPGRHEVLIKGKSVDLTFTEFRILHTLAKRPGWVFSRYQIVDAVRGDDYPVTDRSVDVQIAALRKKLGGYGRYIETVRGIGYRFKD